MDLEVTLPNNRIYHAHITKNDELPELETLQSVFSGNSYSRRKIEEMPDIESMLALARQAIGKSESQKGKLPS